MGLCLQISQASFSLLQIATRCPFSLNQFFQKLNSRLLLAYLRLKIHRHKKTGTGPVLVGRSKMISITTLSQVEYPFPLRCLTLSLVMDSYFRIEKEFDVSIFLLSHY